MKAFFAKYWPSFVHVAAIGIVFASPSVLAYVASHPNLAGSVGVFWGLALHWAQSPKQS